MTVGVTIFTLSYLPALISGVVGDDSDLLPLVLPIAGPWITAELVKPQDWGHVFLGALSGLQAIGAGVFAFGALLPRDPAPGPGNKPTPGAALRVTPLVGPQAWGLSARGVF